MARFFAILIACTLVGWFGAKTLHSAFHVTVGRDARALYYGSRVLLSGGNPYDDNQIVAAWAQDKAPWTYKPGLPSEVFVYPPIMAILFAPTTWLPWQQGVAAVVQMNLLCAVVSALLLGWLAMKRWNFELRVVFVCYILLLPATRLVIAFGQSTFVICACLAGALYALSRKRESIAGLLLALTLAKFTLTLPFLVLLAYRRQWKPVVIALAFFILVDVLLITPIGIVKAITDFMHLIAITTAPNGINDALTASVKT